MQKYCLEFILHSHNATQEAVRSALAEFGEDLGITPCQEGFDQAGNYKININTEEPTVIFDICAQFGRIKSVKVNEATT
ncbi:MAG: hypothetical protein WC628_01555 [Candidatus Omnitrophota bacterium]